MEQITFVLLRGKMMVASMNNAIVELWSVVNDHTMALVQYWWKEDISTNHQ